jgi:inner membrane protein
LAAAAIAGNPHVSARLLLAGVVASVLPDADVLIYRLDIPYEHELGHRGASHSFFAAAVLGLAACLFAKQLHSTRWTTFLFVTLACASHGLLDMLTNGGLGIACFWPFSDERYFFPNQIIQVSTTDIRRFFGPAGITVLKSELLWVWLPAFLAGLLGYYLRRRDAPRPPA